MVWIESELAALLHLLPFASGILGRYILSLSRTYLLCDNYSPFILYFTCSNMAVCPSRVGERDNRMILYLDEDHTTYRYVSNFIIRLTCEVEAGSKSGYLCNVIYYTGDTLGLVIVT